MDAGFNWLRGFLWVLKLFYWIYWIVMDAFTLMLHLPCCGQTHSWWDRTILSVACSICAADKPCKTSYDIEIVIAMRHFVSNVSKLSNQELYDSDVDESNETDNWNLLSNPPLDPCPWQMSAVLYNAEIAPTQPATTAMTRTLALLPSGHTVRGIVLFCLFSKVFGHFCPLLSVKDP